MDPALTEIGQRVLTKIEVIRTGTEAIDHNPGVQSEIGVMVSIILGNSHMLIQGMIIIAKTGAIMEIGTRMVEAMTQEEVRVEIGIILEGDIRLEIDRGMTLEKRQGIES